MSNAEMLIKLREMHEELSVINDDMKSAEHVDEETIDALGQLITDVSVLVDQANETNDQQANLSERHVLLDRIMKFDTEHPRITRFLSQITDVLAMMGI